MKLQNKLLTVLLAGILAVYLGSGLVQRHISLASVRHFSETSRAGEVARQWQWVECVQLAMAASLENVMALGDMDLFEKIIQQQKALPGLQEASLTDVNGRVAYSTVPARLHGELPSEVKPQLLRETQLVKRHSGDSFEIYQPLIADKNCISCHSERHQGDVIGVLSMRFSDQDLKRAEAGWDRFGTDFSRSNAIVGLVTALLLILILALLVAGCVHLFMSVPLTRAAGSLAAQSSQLRLAAGQFSASSQSLAEGSSELAASLEETGAALAQLTASTKQNAEHADRTREIARRTHAAAQNSVHQMETLQASINQINASSADISKINHLIHEIAFQTNLLALNAAVEAARAGQAGMGFGVVAEEVRNLAQRSAAAARETTAKVEGATCHTAQGVQISQQVAVALHEIVIRAEEMENLAAEVAGASREQSTGISQINISMVEMDKVTQNNAATAEETAAAAADLNLNAEEMKRSVAGLHQLVHGPNGSMDQTEAIIPGADALAPLPGSTGDDQPASHASRDLAAHD